MALQKQKTLSNGITADYHQVSNLSVSHKDSTTVSVTVFVALYLNQAARQSSKIPVERTQFKMDVTYSTLPNYTDLKNMAYIKLKTLPEFSGAVDC